MKPALFLHQDKLTLDADFTTALIDVCRSVKGSEYNPAIKMWLFPTSAAMIVINRLNPFLETVTPEVIALVKNHEQALRPQKECPSIFLKNSRLIIQDPDRKIPRTQIPDAENFGSIVYCPKNNVLLLLSRFKFKTIDPEVQKLAAFFKEPMASKKTSPTGIELYPFQAVGVEFAKARKRCGIFDSMGLGKTVQALLSAHETNSYPILVVCPASLKDNWCSEVTKFIGKDIEVEILSGSGSYPISEDADVVIISYNLLNNWKSRLISHGFNCIIGDEAHYLRNSKSMRSESFAAVTESVPRLMLLTGTKVFDKPRDLYHLFHLLDPDGFSDRRSFLKAYGDVDLGNVDELRLRTGHLFIERKKKDVLKDLPPMEKIISEISITEKDMRAYKSYMAASTCRSNGPLAMLTDLRKTTGYLKSSYALAWIQSLLDSTDEAVVIMAQHKKVVEFLAKNLNVGFITGDVSLKKRTALIKKFQTGKTRLIVLSNETGSHGLNLTAGSIIVRVELSWSPGTSDQADCRINRIGQKRQMTSYTLLIPGTFDDFMAAKLNMKSLNIAALTKEEKMLWRLVQRLRM